MSFTRLHTTVSRIKISNAAKARERDKRALREIAAKTGSSAPQTRVSKLLPLAESADTRARMHSLRPVVATPQGSPSLTGVTARPNFWKEPSTTGVAGEGFTGPPGTETRLLVDRFSNPRSTGNRSPGR
jgi:hypothetical protein